jgi:hypothetical protein
LSELIELRLPEAAVLVHPIGGTRERRRDQPAAPEAPVAPNGGEPGALQHPEVFGDRRERHGERPREIADRRLAGREPCEERAAGRIGEGGEGAAEGPV